MQRYQTKHRVIFSTCVEDEWQRGQIVMIASTVDARRSGARRFIPPDERVHAVDKVGERAVEGGRVNGTRVERLDRREQSAYFTRALAILRATERVGALCSTHDRARP